jgi:hypothetical protein
MTMLAKLNAKILDYAKTMPEQGMAEDSDFEVWGKEFCEKMVKFSGFLLLKRL